MIDTAELAARLADEGFTPDKSVLPPLADYLDLLIRWNTAINLTGAHSWQDALHRLVIDSFHLATFVQTLPFLSAQEAQPLCWDLGAGAGLPGIVLRLLWNKGEYWMVEAREKRALFLATVLARNPLPGTRVFRGRLERFFETPQGVAANLVVSRAFMPWNALLALLEGHLRPDTTVIFLLNTLPDLTALPAWAMQATTSYTVDTQQRHICAVRHRISF